MTNLIKIVDGHFVKIGGNLVKTSQDEAPVTKVAGLYDENDNLVKTWDELVAEGLVTVE